MKGYIVGKMIFIFFYLVLTAVYLITEIRDPCGFRLSVGQDLLVS